MTIRGLSRRHFFLSAAAVSAGAAALPGFAAPRAEASDRIWRGSRSANGWPVLTSAKAYPIEGSPLSVDLASDDVATVLVHVARRFNYEIDTLRPGDVTGFRHGRHVTQHYESNYLSGSAIAIRAANYPVGATGLFFPPELTVIRDILAELDGTVSWGGDATAAKESHFEIAVAPTDPRLGAMARRIRAWNDGPGGQGAGALDAFDPARLEIARSFAIRSR